MTDAALILDGEEHPVACDLTWTQGHRHASGRITGDQAVLSQAFEAGPAVLRLPNGRELKIALSAKGMAWTFSSVDH